ncbi:hypothetical protein FRC02_007236 [Tulasnella sp. 418]|nr:hypothetical protein FRC02_007236 [Tulasnella sp. 418]
MEMIEDYFSSKTACVVRMRAEVADANAHLMAIRDEQTASSNTILQQFNDIRHIMMRFTPRQRQSLALIEEQIEERIQQAEDDNDQAEDLLGIRSMNSVEASKSLKDTAQALHMGTSKCDMETRYLKMRVKALTKSFPNLRDQMPTTTTTNTYPPDASHHTTPRRWISTSSNAREGHSVQPDSVRVMIQILTSLQSGKGLGYLDAALELDSLAVMLGDLSMWEEAVRISSWAVQVHCELADNGSSDLMANFARSLHNNSACLWSVGRIDDAIKAAGQSARICRELAKDEPAIFRPTLALSLNNLSSCLIKAGYHGDAVQSSEESVAIYRLLSKDQPNQYLHDMAASLSNSSICLGSHLKFEEAVKASKECVQIYRYLANTSTTDVRAPLASSLSNLSLYLARCNCYSKARSASEEAVGLYKALVQDRCTPLLTDYASSLDHLVYILGKLAHYEDGLKVSEEHVHVLLHLQTGRRMAISIDLANALWRAAWFSQKLGHYGNALSNVDKALEQLAHSDPLGSQDMYREHVAKYLSTKASCLSHLGQHEEALSIGRNAVEILDDLHKLYPPIYAPSLSDALLDYSRTLYRKGDIWNAKEVADTSVYHFEKLARQEPQRYQSKLRRAEKNLSEILSALGEASEAKSHRSLL